MVVRSNPTRDPPLAQNEYHNTIYIYIYIHIYNIYIYIYIFIYIYMYIYIYIYIYYIYIIYIHCICMCYLYVLRQTRKGSINIPISERLGERLWMILLKKNYADFKNEFKTGQAWKRWPSVLSLINHFNFTNFLVGRCTIVFAVSHFNRLQTMH